MAIRRTETAAHAVRIDRERGSWRHDPCNLAFGVAQPTFRNTQRLTGLRRATLAAGAALGAALVLSVAATARADVTAPADDEPASTEIVEFEHDSYLMTRRGEWALDGVVEALRADRRLVVVVATSSSEPGLSELGATEQRAELDEQRRRSIEHYLVGRGVGRARVVPLGAEALRRPAARRLMVYFGSAPPEEEDEPLFREPATVDAPLDEDSAAAPLSFYPVLPAERNELALPEEEEEVELTPPYFGAAEYVDVEEPRQPDDPSRGFLASVGVGLSLGGGVSGFVDGDTRAFASNGGTWDARLTVGTRMPVAVEASYFGSANDIDALGLDTDAVLVGNGLESDIRIELLPRFAFRPYVLGGFGFTHYQVANANVNVSNVRDDDAVFHAPVGAGVSYRAGSALLDVRGIVRAAFDDSLLRDASSERARLSTWGVLAKVGWEL